MRVGPRSVSLGMEHYELETSDEDLLFLNGIDGDVRSTRLFQTELIKILINNRSAFWSFVLVA